MSDRKIKLLLVDQDPIFRTGLRVVVEQSPDLQVAAEAETDTTAFQILTDLFGRATASTTRIPSPAVDLVVLEIVLDRDLNGRMGLKICQQLKTQYPNLPVLLLTSLQDPTQLAVARQVGANGYCPKGIPVSELVAAMRQVAAGQSYWVETTDEGRALSGDLRGVDVSPARYSLTNLRNHLRLSGVRQIDLTLAEVMAQLQPGLPLLDQAILAGQRRELLAARWLVNRLLAQPEGRIRRQEGLSVKPPHTKVTNHPLKLPPTNTKTSSPTARLETSSQAFGMQSTLFEETLAKLHFSLENLTSVPLETDIFREEKKRELLYLILQKISNVLDELRFSQVNQSQLQELKSVITYDLWQAATTDFFGRYSVLRVDDASKSKAQRNLEIVNLLLQDATIVQTEILDKIPLVVDLFSYWLFQTPLIINNASYPDGSPEARERAETLLQNLLINLANGVVQPLLNKLADVEAIKQSFYDQRLISTRELERFRNNLSWKYRLENYIIEPKAIFESRYDLFVLTSRGIAKVSIYAPRNQELTQLSGVQLAVTLVLEFRDAIAPRLRAAVAFLGSGVVYVLTQVIGRAIGLIGRGILQGIKRY